MGRPQARRASFDPHARGRQKEVVADVFPAYDDDGGPLVALTPVRG